MDEEDQVKVKTDDAVRQLSRMPARCPVQKCGETVFPSNLMMHMLEKHAYGFEDVNSEIYDHVPLMLHFEPKDIEYGNCCMVTLCYGGVKDQLETQPGLSFLSLPNVGLINNQHKYDNFLPIMMMVCRTTWFAQFNDKQMEDELTSKNGNKAGIYVFWLVAPNITRKLYYTLTAYDRYYHNSRSVIRTVRDFSSCQNPSEFMPHEDNYLLLRDSEILELMSLGRLNCYSQDNKERGIPMELIIYENPLKPSIQEHPGKLYSKMPRTKGTVPRTVNGKVSLTKRPFSKTIAFL
ncbi:hypothetical protein ACLKA7_015564 [Drosophila subpalustris]